MMDLPRSMCAIFILSLAQGEYYFDRPPSTYPVNQNNNQYYYNNRRNNYRYYLPTRRHSEYNDYDMRSRIRARMPLQAFEVTTGPVWTDYATNSVANSRILNNPTDRYATNQSPLRNYRPPTFTLPHQTTMPTRMQSRVDAVQGQWARNLDSIVFPSSHQLFKPPSYNKKPVCANRDTYCETDDAYPKDYLNRVLKISARDFQETYGDDNSSVPVVEQRIDLINETPICNAVEQVIYPKVAQNKDNNWLYVVNQDQYVQGIRVEKCISDGEPCSINNGAPAGYQTVCRQKYIYRKLLALSEAGKTVTDSFRLPSCCACFTKTIFDSLKQFETDSTLRISGTTFTKMPTLPQDSFPRSMETTSTKSLNSSSPTIPITSSAPHPTTPNSQK